MVTSCGPRLCSPGNSEETQAKSDPFFSSVDKIQITHSISQLLAFIRGGGVRDWNTIDTEGRSSKQRHADNCGYACCPHCETASQTSQKETEYVGYPTKISTVDLHNRLLLSVHFLGALNEEAAATTCTNCSQGTRGKALTAPLNSEH